MRLTVHVTAITPEVSPRCVTNITVVANVKLWWSEENATLVLLLPLDSQARDVNPVTVIIKVGPFSIEAVRQSTIR